MNVRGAGDTAERVRILERAVAILGDRIAQRESGADEEMRDILRELKAIKLFLGRTLPEFKKEFPVIQRKLK